MLVPSLVVRVGTAVALALTLPCFSEIRFVKTRLLRFIRGNVANFPATAAAPRNITTAVSIDVELGTPTGSSSLPTVFLGVSDESQPILSKSSSSSASCSWPLPSSRRGCPSTFPPLASPSSSSIASSASSYSWNSALLGLSPLALSLLRSSDRILIISGRFSFLFFPDLLTPLPASPSSSSGPIVVRANCSTSTQFSPHTSLISSMPVDERRDRHLVRGLPKQLQQVGDEAVLVRCRRPPSSACFFPFLPGTTGRSITRPYKTKGKIIRIQCKRGSLKQLCRTIIHWHALYDRLI